MKVLYPIIMVANLALLVWLCLGTHWSGPEYKKFIWTDGFMMLVMLVFVAQAMVLLFIVMDKIERWHERRSEGVFNI